MNRPAIQNRANRVAHSLAFHPSPVQTSVCLPAKCDCVNRPHRKYTTQYLSRKLLLLATIATVIYQTKFVATYYPEIMIVTVFMFICFLIILNLLILAVYSRRVCLSKCQLRFFNNLFLCPGSCITYIFPLFANKTIFMQS